MTTTRTAEAEPGRRWALAACAWALIFAAASFYWAAGGTFLADTIGGELERRGRAREPAFVATLWVTGVLKVVGGLLALALLRPWRGRRALAWVLGVGGALTALYGVALMVQHGLMAAGVLSRGDLEPGEVRWHLLLWDPFWLLGGVLFLQAARTTYSGYRRRPPAKSVALRR